MTLADLADHASEWMRGDGPESDVVLSSRVRLARNLAGMAFLQKARARDGHEILGTCQRHIQESGLTDPDLWVDLSECSELDRQFLVERHLISRPHSNGVTPRAVAIGDQELVAVMVNEEDHLRMQVLRNGLQLGSCWEQGNQIDDTLEERMDFAYSSKLGYLTACPTNVGTGLRISVMLHLPALKLTNEIEKVRKAARDMHLALRGFYGEGTESFGDFFQLSNQTTLGRSEQELLDDFQTTIMPKVIDYERKAREALVEKRPAVLDDKVHRAWGTLEHARLLGSEETLRTISYLRLGLHLGRIDGLSIRSLNEIGLLTQPAHLQKHAGRRFEGVERREYRAQFVRDRLGI